MKSIIAILATAVSVSAFAAESTKPEVVPVAPTAAVVARGDKAPVEKVEKKVGVVPSKSAAVKPKAKAKDKKAEATAK